MARITLGRCQYIEGIGCYLKYLQFLVRVNQNNRLLVSAIFLNSRVWQREATTVMNQGFAEGGQRESNAVFHRNTEA